MSRESYDRIAAIYATDMGQSMAFDDIGYYHKLCHTKGGRILELGCGTGRILLPLLQSGLDISGIDESPGMLEELQRQAVLLQLQPQVQIGTLTDFGTQQQFSVILTPYSVVTYLTGPEALSAFFATARVALAPEGLLVVDTFIPRAIADYDDFRFDYRRPHQGNILQREKRIIQQGLCNRIERRYTLLDDTGKALETWTTVDLIRPWTAAELVQAAEAAGLRLGATHVDYQANPAAIAQFVELWFQHAAT